MRVLLLSHLLAFGGVEQHMLNLQGALRRRAHIAHVAGLAVYAEFRQLASWAGAGDTLSADDVPLLMSRLNPDVVNIQLPFPAEVAATITRPLVYTAHGVSSFETPLGVDAAGPVVVMDGRYMEQAKLVAPGEVFHIRNGINLARFAPQYSARRTGRFAYYGRIIPVKTVAADEVAQHVTVDYHGPGELVESELVRGHGPCRPEDVGYSYRIVSATGIAALEMMACGAILLAPAHDDGTFRALADSSYAVRPNYGDGHEGRAWEDFMRLAEMSPNQAFSCAAWQRQWVETHHDANDMASRFLRVYEGEICRVSS